LLGCAAAAAGAAVAPVRKDKSRVKVEEISYSGWNCALRMSNGACESVYVPSVNRALHLSLSGGENLFLKNKPFRQKLWVKCGSGSCPIA
jgi:hypothetical protein